MTETNAQNPAGDQIIPRVIEQEMKEAYVNYAMSVIVGRALPDVRDGLKPVHRRILYAMSEIGMLHNKPFKKCARIVGEVLGKFHPHGDTAVYDALVRMAQDFSLRYPLINGQGNFGSIDGDTAAAMRYCVTGDSLILTDKGIVPIGEISAKREQKVNFNITNYQNRRKKVVKFFNSGKHDLIKIVTEQGYELKGSFNHPVLCWEQNNFSRPGLQWKWLSDLTENDYVLINRKSFLFSQNNPNLVSYYPQPRPKEKEIALPKAMNEDLAFLLGALVAEGSFHQKKILFNNKDLVFYNKVKSSILSNFPNLKLYERDIKCNCKELEIYHQKAVRFLANLGFPSAKSDSKEVPHIILRSKRNIVATFMRALFEGDGSVQLAQDKRHQGHSIQITYDSKSLKLISQLKILLLNFGIISGFPGRDKRHECYRLVIQGANNVSIFGKGIGFFSERKNNILNTGHNLNKSRMSKIDYIPFLNEYLRFNYPTEFIKKNNFDRYNNLAKNYSKLIRFLLPADKLMIDWLLEHHYFFNQVKTIQRLKEKESVYSVKVDSSCHSFIANGFVNHNTEARLTKRAEDLLQDIEKNTVDLKDNFDGSLKEPTILPSRLPNLLINGSSGIAVGMATNIPPHNITEVCQAVIATIDNPDISPEELLHIIPGPDFPTGAEVICGNGLHYAYAKGRGRVIIKSIADIQEDKIVVTEIPYQVNKSELIEQIADLVKDKRVAGIRNINDESDREGIRVVIHLKDGADGNVVLNQLYEYSNLKTSFSINLLALVDQQPKTLSLSEMIHYHIKHRQDVIVRRTTYDLAEAEKRIHILDGLLIALNNLDEIIPGIRNSRTVEEAGNFLISRYALTEIQAKAILELRLQKLASLEQEKIHIEHQEVKQQIIYFKEILGSEHKVLSLIKEELHDVIQQYGDARRSRITLGDDEEGFDMEELITEETCLVTMTHSGYVKRLPADTYKTQRRGGKGVKAAGTKEEDFVERVYVASTHDYLLCFTDQGQVYWLKVYQIPEGSRQAKGKHIANVLELREHEQVNAIVPVSNFQQGYLFMVTKQGIVKKTELMEFANPRRGGIRAITFDESDTLVGVRYTSGDTEIIIATRQGNANRFNEKDIRPIGRQGRGVRGIKLEEGDEVIGMLAAEQGMNILTITEKGYGKQTPVSDYRLCNRGGKGVTNIKITEKNGPVKTVMLVDGKEEIMLVSRNGIAIRVKSSEISEVGRATQGVRIMKLEEDDQLAAAAKIINDEVDENGSNYTELPKE